MDGRMIEQVLQLDPTLALMIKLRINFNKIIKTLKHNFIKYGCQL